MKKISFVFILIGIIVLFTPLAKAEAFMIEDIEYPEEKEILGGTTFIDLENLEGEEETTPAVVTPATQTSEGTEGDYILLEPLPCPDGAPNCETGKSLTKFDTTGTGKLGIYLNWIITLFIGLCAVAAVVMIVIGGIEYSTSELISTKSAAKDRIQNAIFGLLLALGSYAILFTINPDLLNTEVDIGGATLTSGGEQAIEDLVQVVGPGVNVNGTQVGIKRGGAAACVGGQVTIPNSFNVNPRTNRVICNNLYSKLAALKSTVNFRITSTTTGTHDSQCHSPGNPKSGNCADIVPIGSTTWDDLCVAIASVGGLNFKNEGSNSTRCNAIQPFGKSRDWSGYHLHVNYIGGSANSPCIPGGVILCPR